MDKDEYIQQLSRYVHLNPVRAKIVSEPLEYPWSSYGSFVGKTKGCEWIETSGVLGHCGINLKKSKDNYRKYVEEVDTEDINNPNKEVSSGFVLGDDAFVKWVYKKFISSREENKEIPELKKIKPRDSIEEVVRITCKEFECEKDYILQKGRKKNVARDLAMYIARDISGESVKNLGEYFGGISRSAVTQRYKSIFSKISSDKKLKKKTNKIKEQILAN